MQQYITGLRIANDVMMLKRQHKGACVIVEGSSDVKFYHKHFNSSVCRIVPAHSKRNVIQAILLLQERGAQGVLGIVDSDFWFLNGKVPTNPNLLITDTHDIETMLVVSPALENVIREYLPTERLDLLEHIGEKVRQTLLEVGIQVGYLRWVSFNENIGLNFDSLPYGSLLDHNTLKFDQNKLIKAARVASNANNLPISDKDIIQKMTEKEAIKANPWHVCQGHDLVFLLEVVLPIVLDEIIGREAAENVRRRARAERLAENLRLAYDASFFVKTTLYISIKAWEEMNNPYIVIS